MHARFLCFFVSRLVPEALQGFPASSCVAERPDAFLRGGYPPPDTKKAGLPARDWPFTAGRLGGAGDNRLGLFFDQSLW